jgi:hypothetical protein
MGLLAEFLLIYNQQNPCQLTTTVINFLAQAIFELSLYLYVTLNVELTIRKLGYSML